MRTSENENGKKMRMPQEEKEMNSELHQLFVDELSDILSAEQQLTKALPKLIKAAQNKKLKQALESHLEETQNHIDRLEQVFKSVGEKVKSKTCKAMKGLIEEGSELVEELEGKSSMNAGIIAAAQKVEHYEIAAYGTVLEWANRMGHEKAAALLEETLAEEKIADEKLTAIAEEFANEEAAEE